MRALAKTRQIHGLLSNRCRYFFFFFFLDICFPLEFLVLLLPIFFFWMAKLLLEKKLFIITKF